MTLLVMMGFMDVALDQSGPAEEPSPEVAKLIAQLGAKEFRARQHASDELVKLGDAALPALRQAATGKVELEVQRRIETVVVRIQAASVEKLLRAYCARQGLPREKIQDWSSMLAPHGRTFRYELAPAKPRDALPPRHVLLFIDPDAGNTYEVKPFAGGDKAPHQRVLAVMRLMGVKVADSAQAAAVMAGLFAIGNPLDGAAHAQADPSKFHMVQVQKGKTWADPPVTYAADHALALRIIMTVDEDGFVTDFRIWNIR